MPDFGGGLRAIDVVPWNLAQIPHRDRSEQLAQMVAASLSGQVPVAGRRVGVILSGRNVDVKAGFTSSLTA